MSERGGVRGGERGETVRGGRGGCLLGGGGGGGSESVRGVPVRRRGG